MRVLHSDPPQGAVITLPYCYLNSELQQALLVRWRRWRLVRRVEAEYNMKTAQTDFQTNKEQPGPGQSSTVFTPEIEDCGGRSCFTPSNLVP